MDNKLPTTYDVASHLFSLAAKPESNKMKLEINNHSKYLIDLWTRSFGCGHTLSLNTVKTRMLKVVKDYYCNVYTRLHRSTKKHVEKDCSCENCMMKNTKRLIEQKWKENNDYLFDIGVDMESLSGDEKLFYEDQKNGRIGKLSDEIDEEYEQDQQERKRQKIEAEMVAAAEEAFINVDDEDTDEDTSFLNHSNFSLNRSGLVRTSCPGVDASTQTETLIIRPKLRINKRVCTDEIKNTCALLSSTCGVSNEMARKIVQLVAKELYGHVFYLTADEQLVDEEEESGDQTVDVSKTDDKPKDLTYVISSARTNSDHKQILASEQESEGACTLDKHDPNTSASKSIFHFDTTSRNNIDGEWPSIILRFTDPIKLEYRLRPLFFAYEDRDQITRLFCETLERLAVAASIRTKKNIIPKMLWEKIDAIMTDAVTKNLKIEYTIAEALGSTHIPVHLLCKSHTVEVCLVVFFLLFSLFKF